MSRFAFLPERAQEALRRPSADAPVRLTTLSRGAGCGSKLSPDELDRVLAGAFPEDAGSAGASERAFPELLVGHGTRDDAAVLDIGGDELLVATTDFFTPVVDDPGDFGRVAAANALSDVYAMGGRPVLALAILGWPTDLLPPELAGEVVAGARATCAEAGIPLAGGHSIDAREPFFGLAVQGLVRRERLRTNADAREGDLLYLTKPLGAGLLTTAEKYGILREEDRGLAVRIMAAPNDVGPRLAALDAVHAMTDVTGFGLLGHLVELCEAAGLSAELDWRGLVLPTDLGHYVAAGAIARGLKNNWRSRRGAVGELGEPVRTILFDPQTSGGLLVAVAPGGREAVEAALSAHGLAAHARPVGRLVARRDPVVRVVGTEAVTPVSVVFGLDGPDREPREREAAAGASPPPGEPALPASRAACTPPRPAEASLRENLRMMAPFVLDLWREREGLRRQDRWIRKFAAKKGYRVNPRRMLYANLRLWLVETERLFGRRQCPCFEPSGDPALDRKMTCPCRFIDADIADKGTCHCGLFGRGDLDDAGFAAAEERLMREYRVELPMRGDLVDTTGVPTDPHRGLKVPDAWHLAKRAVLLRGLPVKLLVERRFEVDNLRRWAGSKGWVAEAAEHPEGWVVTLRRAGEGGDRVTASPASGSGEGGAG